jgi:hypothetical protein
MEHPLGPAMIAYCGAASVCYLLLSTEIGTDRFWPFWSAYQASRLAAFGLFAHSVRRLA